jgi:hypothetical protein
VRVLAVVDPDAVREDTERREAARQRQTDEMVRNVQDVAGGKPDTTTRT